MLSKKFLLLLTYSILFKWSTGYYVMPEVVTIVESPVDTLVCEGCRLELTCAIHYQTETAANLPQPNIKWMINNGTDSTLQLPQALTVSDSIQNSTGNFTISTLTVPNAQLEHQGSYRCVVVDGNDTNHCHSPRFQCVPLVTISREATVEVLNNSTINGRNSDHNSSSIPCNITSHKETVFIINSTNVSVNVTTESTNVIIESANTTIELICPVDECINVSDVVWYHNGEEMSAGEVNGNPSQFYGVYQCFISFNEGHSVEASITRVLPYGLTNPPSKPQSYEIPRANQNIYLAGIIIYWNPPLFLGNLSSNSFQYQISWNDKTLYSNLTSIETFQTPHSYLGNVQITVISSTGYISENGPTATYPVTGDCIRNVRFPPELTLSCNAGRTNLTWINSPRNSVYSVYSRSEYFYFFNECKDNREQLTPDLGTRPPVDIYEVLAKRYKVGTECQFTGARTVSHDQCSWSTEICSGNSRVDCCHCYHPYYLEKSETKECTVGASLCIERMKYFAQENASIVEVCVISEGYGFTADVMTVDDTAKGGEDFSAISQSLTFDKKITTHCINILIYDDVILENNETFELVVNGTNSTLVTITTNSATIEINDNENVAANVTVSSDVIAEGGPPLRVCVQLPPIEKNITLDVTVESITANIEEDVEPPQNQLIFTPTSFETQCINITIIDDDLLETMESFIVVLNTSDTNGVLISENHIEIHIEDNDEVTVALNLSETNFVSEEMDSPLLVCAKVSGSLGQSVTVDIVTIDNTASGGDDYNLTESQLYFNASHLTDCISIDIINDVLLEDSERFTVMLSEADSENVRLSSQTTTIEIEDNDYVMISLMDSSFVLIEPHEGDVPMNICVKVDGTIARSNPVVVFIEVTEYSASNGSDYSISTDTSFSFYQDGQTTLCSDNIISVKGDDVIETEEYFNISLSINSSESVLYGASSHGVVTIQENSACSTSIHFDSDEGIYYVNESNITLNIVITLETTCQIDRVVEVSVRTESFFGAKEGINFQRLNELLLFNNTFRSDITSVKILNLPRNNESELRFDVHISGSDLFDAKSAQVILQKPKYLQFGTFETVSLATAVMLCVALLITTLVVSVALISNCRRLRQVHNIPSGQNKVKEVNGLHKEELPPSHKALTPGKYFKETAV